MANTPELKSLSTQPTYIQVGPGLLWVNVTKPADGAILAVSGNVAGATDQRVYGPVLYTISGRFVGSTIGASNISYRTNFVDINIETSTAKVEKVLDTEEAYCAFNVAELTGPNLRDTLPGSVWNNPIATLTSGADAYMPAQFAHTIKVGGLRLVDPQTIAFISPNRRIGTSAGPFSYTFVGYNAISTEGFDAPFARGQTTVWRVNFELIADTQRTIGDQLFQFTIRQ